MRKFIDIISESAVPLPLDAPFKPYIDNVLIKGPAFVLKEIERIEAKIKNAASLVSHKSEIYSLLSAHNYSDMTEENYDENKARSILSSAQSVIQNATNRPTIIGPSAYRALTESRTYNVGDRVKTKCGKVGVITDIRDGKYKISTNVDEAVAQTPQKPLTPSEQHSKNDKEKDNSQNQNQNQDDNDTDDNDDGMDAAIEKGKEAEKILKQKGVI